MTAEALGVRSVLSHNFRLETFPCSVAPSFFHSCAPGKTARMEDVERFKVRLVGCWGELSGRESLKYSFLRN